MCVCSFVEFTRNPTWTADQNWFESYAKAHKKLSSADVRVTNQKDKDVQLAKLDEGLLNPADALFVSGRFQGHRFPGAERGLLISYDKDDEEERGGSSKRQHEEMRRRKEELERTYTKLHCYVCAHFALKLTTELAIDYSRLQ